MFRMANAADETKEGLKEGLFGAASYNLFPMVIICIVFYFLILRPHQSKIKKHREMLSALKIGDRVNTTGGIIGVVCFIGDEEVQLEVSKNTRISFGKSAIAGLLS